MVASTSYDAKVSEALVQMLADCAAFRTLVGAANATAAKSFIVEDSGGDPAEIAKASDGVALNCATGSYAVVRLGTVDRVDRGAFLTFGHEGNDTEIDIIIRPTPGDVAPDAFRRARNVVGDIAEQLQALFGASAARICWGVVASPSPISTDSIHSLQGAFFNRLPVKWRDIP